MTAGTVFAHETLGRVRIVKAPEDEFDHVTIEVFDPDTLAVVESLQKGSVREMVDGFNRLVV
jgi:hypothetical protein